MSQGNSFLSRLGARRRASADWVLASTTLRYRDWVGDAVITVAAGLVVVVSVFLPWANENGPGKVNYGLSKPAAINGLMKTQFGMPVLVVGIAVMAIGLAMLVFGPNRLAIPLGLGSAAAGVVLFSIVYDAAYSVVIRYDGGLGLVLAFVMAVILPVIGLASGMVGAILSARLRRERMTEVAAEG